MKMLNWADRFEERRTCKDILGLVRKTEAVYKFCIGAAIVITLAGLYMLVTATETRGMLIWLFVALAGAMNVTLVKLWAHLRIVMYYLIWDAQNRLEAELAQSLNEDI